MRNIFLMPFLLLMVFSATAQDTRTFTLADAITYALGNSLEIKNAQIGVADANERILENKALGLPTVSASLGYNYDYKLADLVITKGLFEGNPEFGTYEKIPPFAPLKNSTAAGIEAQSLIFDWSYLKALEAARAYRSFSQVQKSQTEADVKNQVRAAYLPPLILQESKKTLQKNISNLEKLLFETSELYKAGFVEQLDIDRLELSLANLQTEMDNIDRQSQLAYNYLKLAMNYPLDQPIAIADDIDKLLLEASVEDLEGNVNLNNRPEYQVATMGQTLNELNIAYLKATYYPSLVGFANYQQFAQSEDFFANNIWNSQGSVGISLNIPLYSGGAKKAKINRAKLDLEKSNNDLKMLERLIWMEVGNARIAYRNAQQRVADQQRNLDLAQKIYDTTQIKYREGVGSSLEISSAEQQLFQSQQNVIQARYELLQAKVELDKALGK